jgi:hypothetical protein
MADTNGRGKRVSVGWQFFEHCIFSFGASMKRTLVVCLLVSALSTMSGCVGVGGTENTVRPTAGQELIDLKTALDKGAINQTEYDQKKAQILAKK